MGKEKTPFADADWEDMANIERAADKDPEGFDAYRQELDQMNEEAAESGDGGEI